MRLMIYLVPSLLLAACTNGAETPPSAASAAPAQPAAVATIVGASGEALGSASITQMGDGMHLVVKVAGMPAGEHGIHIHSVGQCDAPAFAAAGGHWNPGARKHGLFSPDGAHRGDLRNLLVAADGSGSMSAHISGGMIAGGEGALIDADGAAIVIHVGPDDMLTDPSGNSGGRIACGVFGPDAHSAHH